MKRSRRSVLTSSGTGASRSALAAAPSTGEYSKQPTRSSCATAQPLEQFLEVLLGFAGKSDDEGAANRDVRDGASPGGDPLEVFSAAAGRFISFKMRALACWKGMSR